MIFAQVNDSCEDMVCLCVGLGCRCGFLMPVLVPDVRMGIGFQWVCLFCFVFVCGGFQVTVIGLVFCADL